MLKTNKRNFKAVVAVAALVTVISSSTALMAAEGSRFYLAGYMGLNIGTNQDFSDNSNGTSGEFKTKAAPSFAGALGLRLTKNLRAEAELSYRNLDVDDFDSSGAANITASGDIDNWMGLMNLYYDFDVPWKIKPYVSAGLGMGYFDGNFSASNGANYNDSDYALTWQAGAGLQYRSSDKLSWTAGYRYLDSADLDIGNGTIDYSGHEVRVGLKYDLDWE